MEILTVNIEDIKPYENNAKEHPRDQIEQIKKSIVDYGNNDPIAVDENNVIIEGHGRYIAMSELGYDTVEIIRLEHLTEEQKKAYRLVHNKLTMNSDFDFTLLEKELAELSDMDVYFDMSVFNFGDIYTLPDEVVLDREDIGNASNMASLKYGSTVIYMTEEENDQFDDLLKEYLENNGTLYGFIAFLLGGVKI